MNLFTSQQAAEKLGVTRARLQGVRHRLEAFPNGGPDSKGHLLWTEADIAKAKKALAKPPKRWGRKNR